MATVYEIEELAVGTRQASLLSLHGQFDDAVLICLR